MERNRPSRYRVHSICPKHYDQPVQQTMRFVIWSVRHYQRLCIPQSGESGQIAYSAVVSLRGFLSSDQLRFIPGIRVDGFTYNQNRYISGWDLYILSSGIDLTGSLRDAISGPDLPICGNETEQNLIRKATTGIPGESLRRFPPTVGLNIL